MNSLKVENIDGKYHEVVKVELEVVKVELAVEWLVGEEDGTIGLLALAIRLPRYSGMEGGGADAAEGVVAGEAPAWAAW